MSCRRALHSQPLLSTIPRIAAVGLTLALSLASGAQSQPVATAEGQFGDTPSMDDQFFGSRFEPIRGNPDEVLLGGLFVFGGSVPPPPAMAFFTDKILGAPGATEQLSIPSPFVHVAKSPPASARSRNATNTGDFIAFSFAVDGVMPQTMSLRVATFDEKGDSMVEIPVATVGTFPDPAFNDTGVAVDDQGRVTVAYTDLTSLAPLSLEAKAQRFDGITGLPIGGTIPLNATGETNVDVALLDPAGNRLIIATADFSTGALIGRFLDTTGATPLVLPEFMINSGVGFSNVNPAVAADPSSGRFTVAWESLSGVVGDPVNVRARRFDADGNPIGNDFQVNTTTENGQGQPAVAFGPGGESVVAWAGDGAGPEDLDVFAQAYDAQGNPIGGEFRVNTFTANVQDRPSVLFLPELGLEGQPQFVVGWRDVGDSSGNEPRGTGLSYKVFLLEDEDTNTIFDDGFESGDTSSWSPVLVP